MLSRRKAVRELAKHRPDLKTHEDALLFYALPTQAQAKRVAWDALKSLIPSSWLARRGGISESDRIIKTDFGTQLHLMGMDRPERIEGNQWRFGVLDESCDQKPGAFDRSVRPALSHYRGGCWRIGVPKRFGCGAAEFKGFYETAASDTSGDEYAAWSWSSRTVLPEEEIVDAQSRLDERDFAEQYDALWQGVSGLVFYNFNEHTNVRDCKETKYNSSLPIIVGSDFNVDPMAWVFMHRIGNVFYVFDELWMRNTNTIAALSETHRRYGNHKAGWLFIGDATARARNTRATQSDYAHIRNDMRFERARIAYPKSNPAVTDRFASCNAHLRNALGETRLVIAPKCTHLIHDLSNRAYKEGTREVDDYGDVGHITDALGYPIHYIAPVTGAAPPEGASNSIFVSTR